jgi:hypothetical protein
MDDTRYVEVMAEVRAARDAELAQLGDSERQGLTLVPISAQLELTFPFPLNLSLLCPPYHPN